MIRMPHLLPWRALAAAGATLVLACGVALAAPTETVAPKPLHTGLETLEKQVQEFTLSNGLRFLVVERHQAPVFSFFTIVNSGSANDAVGTTGIAHMMEHMAFKGSRVVGTTDYRAEKPLLDAEDAAWAALHAEQRRGAHTDSTRLKQLTQAFEDAQKASSRYVVTNEATRVIEQAGGQGINAFTAEDITAYFYSLPSNRLELWAAMHGGTLVDPVFREFYKERDVVYEERRMRTESSPIGRLYNEFVTTVYTAHPYGFGGIGYPSDLKSIDRPEGEAFFRRNYVAKNMTIAVVGDVTLAQVRQMAEKYFSAVSSAPAPLPLDTGEPQQSAERRIILEDKAQPFTIVGWHIPAASDPTYAAYKAAADLLGGGRWSRMYKTLVKEKKVAVELNCNTGMIGEKYPSLFTMILMPAKGQDPEVVEKEAYAVIDSAMTSRPFTTEELDGYKVRMRAAKIGAVDDNEGLAGELAQSQTLYGDWHEFFREQERLQSLRPEDLTAVMQSSLVRSNRTVAFIKNPPATAANEGGH